MSLWSGRFDAAPDAALFEFGRSFPFDRRLFHDDVTGSIAWAEALRDAGVLTREEGAALLSALSGLLEQARGDPRFLAGDDEDVHTFVERQLVARAGDVGKRLHTGRSRNEQVSLDLRLYLRRRIPVLVEAVVGTARELVTQAECAGDAIMPAYTHLRRAQPVLVAHFLLAHVEALRRDCDRLYAARREADGMPLGSGAVAGTNYAVDVAALARRLGFSRVARNSIDASADRDFVSTFLHAGSLVMVHLSRIAEDFVLLTGEEFGFFELADSAATGSSLMPQKKNPDPLELIRGKTGRVIGRLAGWLATMKGLPSGYNKDLQEDKEAVFEVEDTLLASLAATGAVVSGLSLNQERALTASAGLLLATDVADYLVARGMAFRAAHEVVGAIVRTLLATGRDFGSLSIEEWRRFSPLFGDDIAATISPRRSVEARRTPQSTSPAAVAEAVRGARRWVEEEAQRGT
ncbi:MAG: argininosuccinate lyase [Bacteroidales bacterium]